jgi:hypothetical protein
MQSTGSHRKFWIKCFNKARAGGLSSFANDWQWTLAVPLATSVGLGVTMLSTGYPAADGFVAAFFAFAVTWIIALFVKTLNAAPQLYYEEKGRADALEERKDKQRHLDEIAALRTRLVQLRIAMEGDETRIRKLEQWQETFLDLEDKIAYEMEQFSSKAEADIYRNRGNLRRDLSWHRKHQIYIDMAAHDIEHLKEFIKAYSRSRLFLELSNQK